MENKFIKREETRTTLMDLDLKDNENIVEQPKKKKMTKKKFFYILKKNRRVQIALAILLILIILITVLIVKGINVLVYHSSDEYKLIKLGYTNEEATKMITSCDADTIKMVLNHEYNGTIDDFVIEKYFLEENLERYLSLKMADSSGKSYETIVAEVNTNRDREMYSDMKAADTSLNELVFVNKYYNLSESFEPSELSYIPLSYAYGDLLLSNTALEKFEEMCDACETKGYTIVAEAAYRSYEWQSNIWEEYKNSDGISYADVVAARAGSSDHQTGLAVNIREYGNTDDIDSNSDLYNWLLSNAHNYGFIQRYPKGKENITGFDYEPGHFRYVGVEAATEMYNLGLTFDEYYAYFIEAGRSANN